MVGEYESNADLEAKRRKVRRGTRSCWECKGRKMKCIYVDSSSDNDIVCIGCQRRGSKCLSQEFEVEANITPQKRKGGQATDNQDQLVRLEGLVKQLMKKVASDDTLVDGETPANSDNNGYISTYHGVPTPASFKLNSLRLLNPYKHPEVCTDSFRGE